MLNQDTNKTLEGTEYGTVKHHRAVLITVLANEVGIQALGKHKVHL